MSVLLEPDYAPELPFERPDGAGGYTSLGATAAVVALSDASAGPASMGVQTDDVTMFTQSGELYVPRGSDLRAGDRLTFSARKYELMGVANWDQDQPFTGDDFGWVAFKIQIDAKQLIADLLALRGQVITLVPTVSTSKPGGGNAYGPGAPRSPQTFVLTSTKAFDGAEDSQTDRGLARKLQFRLVGAADAEIALGDTWEDAAAKYTVETIDRTNQWDVEAIVVGFLKVSGHSYGS